MPYCGSCYDRIMKERYSKNVSSQGTTTTGGSTTTTSTANNTSIVSATANNKPFSNINNSNSNSTDNFQSFELSEEFTRPKAPTAADKFRNLTTTGTKKCPICTKTVYQAEEMVCMKLSFHKECFTCGGNGGKGCKRRLAMGEAHGM